jgi:hypothetical protein
MSTTVKGLCHTTAASFARPANTTTYTAGDVVCNAATLIFPNGPASTGSVLQHAVITTSANVATKPDLELWLFSATVAAVADNAAFAPTDAEMLTLVAVVEFPTADFKVGLSGAGTSGNAVCEAKNLGIPLNPASAQNAELYGQIVVRNAYEPISAEAFKVVLHLVD